MDISRLIISKQIYTDRKTQYEHQVESVLHYASSTSTCRSQILLAYFGEANSTRCGNCDVCESMNDLGMSNMEFERIQGDIKNMLLKEPCFRHELFFHLKGDDDKKQRVIRWLLDNGKIVIRIDEKLEWQD